MKAQLSDKQASADFYAKLIENIDGIVWQYDPESACMTFVSPAAEKILGYPLDEWLQPNFWINHVHPEDRAWVGEYCQRETLAGRSHDFEYRIIAANGETLWLRDIVTVMQEDGRVKLRGLMIDITDKKKVEHERQLNLRLFRTLFSNSVDGMLLQSAQGMIIDVNNKACELLGHSKTELIGKYPDFFDSSYSSEKAAPLTAKLDAEEMIHFESQHRRKDGSTYPVDVWVKGFWVGSERLAIAQFRDLSDRMRLEEQFRQAQKMEAVGRLAGGMAHDFNNLLTVIGGYCELMLAESQVFNPHRNYVVEVMKANQRATALTQQLLGFSRRKLLQPQVVDINKRLIELSNLLERLLGGNVALTFALEATQANALVDPGHFEHAIVNLVVNARDAIPNGGAIQIATSNSRQPVTVVQFESLASQCGPSLEISVTDNGTGMEENVLSRVFEPFFTTKEQGKGTGLGLAMVYGFVQQSSGEIAVESKLGSGSTFRILLPTVLDQPSCSNDATTKVVPQGTETVLLVEDEKSVRELTELTLRKHGYRVLVAADGVDGLAVAGQFNGKIDLLISDLVMPQMNGWQLAQSLLKTRPDLRLLFISGYLDRSAGPQTDSLPEFGYCQKPFTPQSLLAKIQEVMRVPNVS